MLFRSSLCYHITSVGRFQSAPTSSGQIGEEPPGNLGKGIHMSDVENKEDFEGHKKGGRSANDDDTSDDFEGHKMGGGV